MTSRRIVLHPGFHKTGTTSIQRFLHDNGKAIYPTHAIGMDWRFPDLLSATRGFSVWRDDDSLAKAALRFAAFISKLDLPRGRNLVISAEALSGHLPGRDGLADYSAAPVLMAEFVRVLEAAYKGDFELAVLITTRDADPWLNSVWAEHVKSSRMILDRASFRSRFAQAADFDPITGPIAKVVAPHALHLARLEDIRSLPLGPATPLVDLMGLREPALARLRPATTHNASPDGEVLEELLRLNRSDLDKDALHAAKRAVLSAAASR